MNHRVGGFAGALALVFGVLLMAGLEIGVGGHRSYIKYICRLSGGRPKSSFKITCGHVCIFLFSFHSHHGVFGDLDNIEHHQAGIKHSVQSKLDDQMNQSLLSALKPRNNQSVKSYNQHTVQSVSQHSVEAQNHLLKILTTNHHKSFEDEHQIVHKDEEEEEDTEKRVGEDEQVNHQRVNVKTVNESDTDSKSNVPKEQLLETIGEEYYLYDGH